MPTSTPRKEQEHRLRVYQARTAVHDRQVARRSRDQLVGGVIAVGAIVLSSLAYWAWSSIGPGAPVDEPVAEEAVVEEEAAADTAASASPVPDISLSEYRIWEGEMDIADVPLGIELDGARAPQAVANFVSLVDIGFYDGITCHRLTTDGIFVLQCGDPVGDGTGGPEYRFGPIENAPADNIYAAGTLAMARAANDGASMGSQFFIVYADSPIPADQAGGYTVFGSITEGLEQLVDTVVSGGVQGDGTDGVPAVDAVIGSITIR